MKNSTATASKKSSKTAPVAPAAEHIAPGTQVTVTVVEKPVVQTTATIDPNKMISYPLLETLGIIKSFGGLESGLGTDTKNIMLKEGAKKAESTSYEAQLSGGGTPDIIDPGLFFKLCTKKGIKQDQISEVVSITKGKVSFLSEDEITKISVPGTYSEPSLTVTRKKSAPPLKVVEAIELVAAEAKKGKFPVDMPAKKSSKK